MKHFLPKLKFIYLPFILWGIGFTALFTFLNWLLVIKTNLISLQDIILEFALPITFTGLFVFIWLRRRVGLLRLKTKNGDLPMLYLMIATIALSIPVIIAQMYIATASGELTELNNINQFHLNQLNGKQQTKYYSFEEYYINRRAYRVHHSFETSGKYNEHLNFNLHAVVPILSTPADTASKADTHGWLALKFTKQVSNRLSEQEKETAYQQFLKESWEEFAAKDLYQSEYFDKISNSSDLDKYKWAVWGVNKQYWTSDNPAILVPIQEPFAARNGNKLFWIFASFGIGAAVWLFMISLPKINLYKLKQIQKGSLPKDRDLQEFFSFFVPRDGYFVTPIILNLNLLAFALMVISGLGFISFAGPDLLNWGANFGPLVVQNNEWWRLLTSVFLHGGIMHLLMNMVALLFAAALLEPMLGKYKFASLYLLTGLIASLSSLWWYSAMISVGASGAIFGLYGFLLALLLNKVFPNGLNKALLISAGVFVGLNLLMGFGGGIDNAAHLGGLASGFILGIIYYHSYYKNLEPEPEPEEEPQESVLA